MLVSRARHSVNQREMYRDGLDEQWPEAQRYRSGFVVDGAPVALLGIGRVDRRDCDADADIARAPAEPPNLESWN